MQDLGMGKSLQWPLLPEQTEHWAAVANDLIQTAINEPDFLKMIKTGEELWVYGCHPEKKAQLSHWKSPGSPRLKKAQQGCRKIKTMSTVFFDWEGVVLHEYAHPGQTINKEYYLNVLCWLRDAVPWKLLQLWATCDWQFHHNNVTAHASCLMQFFGEISNHPGGSGPYSPDLVPCEFWLFQKLKLPLKGKRFQIVDEIQENITVQLMVIGRTLWGPKVPTLKVTEASLSYVQCFLYLMSSSINVSIFHMIWLDTFWTDLVAQLSRWSPPGWTTEDYGFSPLISPPRSCTTMLSLWSAQTSRFFFS